MPVRVREMRCAADDVQAAATNGACSLSSHIALASAQLAHGIPGAQNRRRGQRSQGIDPDRRAGKRREGKDVVEEITSLIGGFNVALSWYNLALMIVGILLGVIIGVLPGLGGANGVAILLPLTFSMPPTSAIIMLSCIYWGALFGGAITSILFNIPGEPWSVATTFDGHPMAQQGRADEALTAAFTSSFVGALVAVDHDHLPRAAGRASSRCSSGRPSSSRSTS